MDAGHSERGTAEHAGKQQDLSGFKDLRGNPGMLLWLVVLGWTVGAVVEELAYRGYLQTRLRQLLGHGPAALFSTVLVSSLLFGRVHSEQGIIGMLVVTIDGIAWSLLRYRYTDVVGFGPRSWVQQHHGIRRVLLRGAGPRLLVGVGSRPPAASVQR